MHFLCLLIGSYKELWGLQAKQSVQWQASDSLGEIQYINQVRKACLANRQANDRQRPKSGGHSCRRRLGTL
jgi:hypothetical protein